jgi:hypothetical protein
MLHNCIIVVVVAKYTSSFGLFARIPHLKGAEMFGSTKCKTYLPPRLEADSHRHDRVNFFHLKVANAITPINQSLIVDVGEASNLIPIITHTSVEVLKCFCGDNIWRIKRCPQSQTLIVQCCKKTLNIIAKPKSFQNKQIMVFLLCVMLVIGL